MTLLNSDLQKASELELRFDWTLKEIQDILYLHRKNKLKRELLVERKLGEKKHSLLDLLFNQVRLLNQK